jgi:DNA invertase Pin-like site-specific DNA recombinase
MTTAAVFYGRCSTDHQEDSIDDQRKAVESYALKQGYTIVRSYTDEGISGDATEKRLAFQRMLRDAKQRRDFEVILCWDQDRFGRFDPLEAGYWIKPLRDVGVRLETIAQGRIDWNDFRGRLLYNITQEGKHAFLLDLTRNSMRGKIEGVKAGEWQGGAPPFGYKAVERLDVEPRRKGKARPRRLVPGDLADVETVRWIFETYATRDVSLTWLCRELIDRGRPTPRGYRLWCKPTLSNLLKRREYVGDLNWGRSNCSGYVRLEHGEVRDQGRKAMNEAGTGPARTKVSPRDFLIVENCHEPLVSREVWEKVQAKLAGNRGRTTPQVNGGKWLLAKMLVCGQCGSRMVGSQNCHRDEATQGKRYICANYHMYGARGGCHRHGVREAPLLRCIFKKLQDAYLNPANLEALRAELRRQLEEDGDPDRLRRLRARTDELQRQIDRGTRNMALADDPETFRGIADTVRGWREEKEVLAKELQRLETGIDRKRMEATIAEAEAQLWRLREAATSADPTLVRAVLREMIDRVELHFDCQPLPAKGYRQRCSLDGGVIYLHSADPENVTLVAGERASLWL